MEFEASVTAVRHVPGIYQHTGNYLYYVNQLRVQTSKTQRYVSNLISSCFPFSITSGCYHMSVGNLWSGRDVYIYCILETPCICEYDIREMEEICCGPY